MKLSDPIKISYRSLTASKLRFFLTVLGIVIGVAAVILVQSIGASAQDLVLSQINEAGSNLIGVLPGASEESGPPASVFGVVTTTLTNDDLKAMRERNNVPHLLNVSGYVSGSAVIGTGRDSYPVTFQGVSPEMADIENIDLADGRFFLADEESDLSRVIVLGHSIGNDLFPDRNPIGETVTLGDTPFRVVGTLEARGSSAFSNPDGLVFVPLVTAQKLLIGIDYLNFIRGEADSPDTVAQTKADIEALLIDRHDIDIENGEDPDFSVRSSDTAIGILTSVTDVLTYFLSAVAGISLLVGGVGIMNSMLISVSQRIREIGLRKAVGARPDHIATQFLIESSFVTVVGGMIGIALGIALAFVAAIVIRNLGYEWAFIVPLSSILLGFSVSVAIGAVFGLYPALKASKVPPIEALRYE